MNVLNLIGRNNPLFEVDINTSAHKINDIVESSSFLVIGGAGSIGQSVVKEIFKRNPIKLHVVDISENNMVELVRDIRSSLGYIDGDFRTFALDIGSIELFDYSSVFEFIVFRNQHYFSYWLQDFLQNFFQNFLR